MSEELDYTPTPAEDAPEETPASSPVDPSIRDLPVSFEPESPLIPRTASPLVFEEPGYSPEYSGAEPKPEPRREPEVPKAPRRSPVASFVEFAEVLVSALVAAILVLTLVCRTGVVEGSSMEPTMHGGDRYIISDLFYTPEQGDIVVFRPDIEGKEELWIKRIIAVEGQEVYISATDFKVYVDGVLLDEPYLSPLTGTLNKGTENPIVVPEDCVYVLGDNRSVSHDSRYPDLGCVPIRMLAGRVVVRFWPFSAFQFYG